MKANDTPEKPVQSGYSLVELLIVVCLLAVIAAVAYARLYSSSAEVGGAERVLEEAARKVVERRSEAVRLNGVSRQNGVTINNAPPLPINFASLSQTASLSIEADANGDCLDDVTNSPVTCLVSGSSPTWQLAYRNDTLVLPKNWSVAQSAADLGSIPLIGSGTGGLGVLVTQVGFDADGRAFVNQSSQWVGQPSGTVTNGTPDLQKSPFWAIYFVGAKNSTPAAAVAVAVHPSGYIERFRYDGSQWIGYQNRTLTPNSASPTATPSVTPTPMPTATATPATPTPTQTPFIPLPTPTPTPQQPLCAQITNFSASPTVINGSGSTTISWSAQGAGIVMFEGMPVSPSGSQSFTLSSSRTFNLIAYNLTNFCSATQQVTVQVNPINNPQPTPPPPFPMPFPTPIPTPIEILIDGEEEPTPTPCPFRMICLFPPL